MPDPIFLLVTDLAALHKLPSLTGRRVKLSPYHFAPFKHWALQVRSRCYEVNSRESTTKPGKREYFLNNGCSIEAWLEAAEKLKLSWERVEVGATNCSDEEIREKSDLIWKDRFKKKFRLDQQNCQNFSYLLYKSMALEPDKIKNDVKKLPRRFTQIAGVLKSCVTSSIARAIVLETITDAMVVGAELIGIESVIGLEVLGLEVAGVALLGPIGEVIIVATLILFLLKKSRDKKWLARLKKLGKKQESELNEYERKAFQDEVRMYLREDVTETEGREDKAVVASWLEEPEALDRQCHSKTLRVPPGMEEKQARVAICGYTSNEYSTALMLEEAAPEYRPQLPPRMTKSVVP